MEMLINALIIIEIIGIAVALFVLVVVVWAWLSTDFTVFRELNERLTEKFNGRRGNE